MVAATAADAPAPMPVLACSDRFLALTTALTVSRLASTVAAPAWASTAPASVTAPALRSLSLPATVALPDCRPVTVSAVDDRLSKSTEPSAVTSKVCSALAKVPRTSPPATRVSPTSEPVLWTVMLPVAATCRLAPLWIPCRLSQALSISTSPVIVVDRSSTAFVVATRLRTDRATGAVDEAWPMLTSVTATAAEACSAGVFTLETLIDSVASVLVFSVSWLALM